MKKTALFALTAALFLSACDQKSETSVSPETTSSAASAIAEAASAPENVVQTLTSKDGKIHINIENSTFADASKDTALLPPNTAPADVVMLQRDETQDIILYATHLGKPKRKAGEYFAKLKQNIEADASLKDVRIGTATENRMDYHFTQSNGDETLSETCVALYAPTALYNVCANSPSATPDQLENVLNDIKLTP